MLEADAVPCGMCDVGVAQTANSQCRPHPSAYMQRAASFDLVSWARGHRNIANILLVVIMPSSPPTMSPSPPGYVDRYCCSSPAALAAAPAATDGSHGGRGLGLDLYLGNPPSTRSQARYGRKRGTLPVTSSVRAASGAAANFLQLAISASRHHGQGTKPQTK